MSSSPRTTEVSFACQGGLCNKNRHTPWFVVRTFFPSPFLKSRVLWFVFQLSECGCFKFTFFQSGKLSWRMKKFLVMFLKNKFLFFLNILILNKEIFPESSSDSPRFRTFTHFLYSTHIVHKIYFQKFLWQEIGSGSTARQGANNSEKK